MATLGKWFNDAFDSGRGIEDGGTHSGIDEYDQKDTSGTPIVHLDYRTKII